MIEFQVDTSGLTRMEKSLAALAGKQFRYATSQALNDCTRAAANNVNAAMPELFDRPTAFTDRAAVAPRALAATRDSLISTVTLRDIQAQYLKAEEDGGTRTPADNTRKPDAKALVLPGIAMELNQYGNIPDGLLKSYRAAAQADKRLRQRLAKKAKKHGVNSYVRRKVEVGPRWSPTRSGTIFYLPADAPANKAKIAGYFRRLNKGQISRLTAFEPQTHYNARMGYHARVKAVFAETWGPALQVRFQEAIATMR